MAEYGEHEAKAAEPYEPPAPVVAGRFARVTRGPVGGGLRGGYLSCSG